MNREYPYDDQFPQNVNPTEENRRKFSEDMERQRKEAEKEAEKANKENDSDKGSTRRKKSDK